MTDRDHDLTPLGWTPWFQQRSASLSEHPLARVAAVDRDQLLLVDAAGRFRATLSGSYLHHHTDPQDRPSVGDWVGVEKPAGSDRGVVHALLPRRTALRRKSPGSAVDYQMIAANVDCVLVVQSCHRDFNVKRLERYLVMVTDGGAEAGILLTKTDLVEPEVVAAQVAEIRAAGIAAPMLALSNVTREGVAELERWLVPAKTYCFVGSSGVGKSTLINHLLGREVLATADVSGTGEGRHTTVRRELFLLAGGALVIDNPGMRELGLLGAEGAVESSFPDLAALAAGCRFRDCRHGDEPGCAVRQAVESGAIGAEQLESFLKLRDESAFHQMTYAERRRKDRDFGRFIKSAKRDLKGG